MKKFILAAAVVLTSSVAFTSCTKDNVKPTASINTKTTADKSDVAQADINGSSTTTTTAN